MFKLTPKIDPKKGPKMCQIDLQMHFFTNSNFQKCRKIENSPKNHRNDPERFKLTPILKMSKNAENPKFIRKIIKMAQNGPLIFKLTMDAN